MRPNQVLRPRHVPVPVRLWAPRGSREWLHRDGYRRAPPPDGWLQCPSLHGLGRVHHRPERRQFKLLGQLKPILYVRNLGDQEQRLNAPRRVNQRS